MASLPDTTNGPAKIGPASPLPADAPVPGETIAALPVPVPRPEEPVRPQRAGERMIVMVVRGNVRQPQDLDGRPVAFNSSTSDGEDVRRALSNAGVTLKPVDLGFAPALQGLARGDVDGVLLSVGPRLSGTETNDLQLGDFHLLQIPFDSAAP